MLKAVLKVLLGLSLGLGLAELAFSLRDDGAFPHLNLYEPDPEFGVRLQPNAEMRLKLGKNPTTTVRTNQRGFRGADWPAPAANEVLVVGDSQVFGLGVEAEQTFSAQLATLTARPVLNAGVPTYGPPEYTALVERLVKERKPTQVVYVMNLANDLFELGRPNAERHRVWDGWAVRTETAPEGLVAFPFRHLLMNRSHLVYAARRLGASKGAFSQESASEGTWRDVVSASERAKPVDLDDRPVREALATRNEVSKQLDELQTALVDHLTERITENDAFAEASKVIEPLQRGDPRDIVQVPLMEGARSIDLTANQLFQAALASGANEERLRELAKKMNDPELVALMDRRKALRASLSASLRSAGQHEVSPLEAHLAKTKASCDAAGASLLVVALPLDVMVSSDEWAKYGTPARDLSLTKVLLDDLVSRAEAVGAVGLDPSPALLAAEPGAFLDGDLHLTPKGHRALAEAIAQALEKKPKPKSPLELPDGRSWPPTQEELRALPEVTVKGSTALSCETRQVREWFWMRCRRSDGDGSERLEPRRIEVHSGGHGDAVSWGQWSERRVLLPVLEGESATLLVSWADRTAPLTVEHPVGQRMRGAFGAATKHPKSPPTQKVCTELSCLIPWEDPLRPITCPDGERPSGALRRCAPPCAGVCDAGTCHPWPGGSFCAAP